MTGQWPFKELTFEGHLLATSQTVGGQWYAYINHKFIAKYVFQSQEDAINWMKWKIKNGDL